MDTRKNPESVNLDAQYQLSLENLLATLLKTVTYRQRSRSGISSNFLVQRAISLKKRASTTRLELLQVWPGPLQEVKFSPLKLRLQKARDSFRLPDSWEM